VANVLRWTYGGNRLQVKAEIHIMSDIQTALEKVRGVGAQGYKSMKSLQAKQELLLLLLANEQMRLMVWLFPMDFDKKQNFLSQNHRTPPDVSLPKSHGLSSCQRRKTVLSTALKTAWAERPSLAVHLAERFNSQTLTSELRWLLLNFPEKVLDQPDALEVLLGSSLPNDVSFQLKVNRRAPSIRTTS